MPLCQRHHLFFIGLKAQSLMVSDSIPETGQFGLTIIQWEEIIFIRHTRRKREREKRGG